jgi:hypothetical protein
MIDYGCGLCWLHLNVRSESYVGVPMDLCIYSLASINPPLPVVSCSVLGKPYARKHNSVFVERTIKMEHMFSEPWLGLLAVSRYNT